MSDPIPPVVHSDRTFTLDNFAALVDRVKHVEDLVLRVSKDLETAEKELADLKPKINHVFGTRR